MGAAGLLAAATLMLVAAPPARAGDPERAREMFKQGSVYFDLGQFDRAIEVWQRGYEEKPDAAFLYNIAQAYRLAGDPRKALFFYKSFLRNSPPNAPERREVEQKIAALQKQVADGGEGPGPAAPAPPGAATAPPPAGAEPAEPPGGGPAVPPGTGTTEPAAPPAAPGSPDAPTTAIAPAGPVVPAARVRHVDIGAWIGASFWLSGINGSAAPAVSVSATGGYTFGADAGRIARFRLGGRMGATFLDDVSSELALLSMLADPAVVLRLSGDRLFVTGDVGVGLLLLTGLQPGSALLEPGASPTGRQALLEIRPGAAFDYRLTPALSLLLSSGVAFTPKADHFYAPFLRLELHFGLAVRL